MAKYELPIYDMATEEITKTYGRNKIGVSLYLKYQQINEDLQGGKFKSDDELFAALQDVVVETFDGMTKAEYNEQTDPADVLNLYRTICNKGTLIYTGNSKN